MSYDFKFEANTSNSWDEAIDGGAGFAGNVRSQTETDEVEVFESGTLLHQKVDELAGEFSDNVRKNDSAYVKRKRCQVSPVDCYKVAVLSFQIFCKLYFTTR